MSVTPGREEPNLKAHQRMALLRDIVSGQLTVFEMSLKYERAESTIYHFKKVHAHEIDAMRADARNEFAALWVADKVNRVATYQDDIETLNELEDPQALKLKHNALRAVAEEMGQLTTKAEVNATVQYEVTGVDPEAMR